MRPTLRRGDGYGNGGTPHLMPAVTTLQKALDKAGYDLERDGLFGKGTENAVKAFQRDRGLVVDGIAGPATWRAMDGALPRTRRTPDYSWLPGFETFHGDLPWVHEREGHGGRPYWPGGRSGVTFDPGFDLGYQTMDTVNLHYGDVLSEEQRGAVQGVLGLRGQDARQALAANPVLHRVRFSRTKALKIMPHIAVRYWKPVTKRFRGIGERVTPDAVQTVMLSLAYNRGPGNRDLEQLKDPIAAGRWLAVADLVGAMQQDHPLPGIRIRRRMEADLIRQENDFG